jgi:hypothetical protein
MFGHNCTTGNSHYLSVAITNVLFVFEFFLNLFIMKKLTSLFFAICFVAHASAQHDVTMTVTFHGKPVCNYELLLKHGDAVIGKGITDNTGTVVFVQAPLLVMNVDLYAEKKKGGANQHFDVKGYIVLNEDYSYELKMEDLLKEITSGSGMPESMFADSWGLTSIDCN